MKALPVSWVAGSTTSQLKPTRWAIPGRMGPRLVPGHLRPMENAAAGNARRRQHLSPIQSRVAELSMPGGGGFGISVGLPPGQAVVQIIRNHEEILRLVQLFPRRP